MLGEYIKILLVILLSSVKFIGGPWFAYAFNKQYNLGVLETIIYSLIGGMLGVVVFTYFSTHLFRFWSWVKRQTKLFFRKREVFSEPVVDFEEPVKVHYTYVESSKSRKVFTRRNRRFVRIWNLYGLIGVAFLTPVVFSIPIGTIVANSLVRNKKKIFLYMFFSILFWSIMINLIFEVYQIQRVGLVPE